MKNQSLKNKLLTACIGLSVAPASFAALEEIVVTATKRAEGIQDVPVSVSAVSNETMEAAGITDMAELAAYIPNFEVSDASILPNLYVRGIGSGTTHSIEQSVGRFIDEVYIGRAAINLHGLMDVAGVEVLRGPQGTLFGKNTLGGAMIIRTGDPTETFEGRIKGSASSYSTTGGTKTIDGYVSGPLGENLLGRLAFQWKDKDGFVQNVRPGPDGGTRDDWGVRAKFSWDMGESTRALLKLEHMEYEEEGQVPSETVSGSPPGGPFAGGSIEDHNQLLFGSDFQLGERWISYIDCTSTVVDPVNNSTFCPGREQDSQNVTLQIDHDFESGTLTSISAFQKYFYDHLFVAIDQGIAGGALRAQRVEELDAFSQEFRFTSEASDNFDYIAGVFFETSDLSRDQLSHFNVPSYLGAPPFAFSNNGGNYNSAVAGGPPHVTDIEDWVQDTQTIAVFGQFSYALSEHLELTVGGRWATEDKDFTFIAATTPLYGDVRGVTEETADPDPAGAQTTYELRADSRSESKFTPSVTLRYDAGDSVSYYASVSQGHKTGGFSDRDQEELGFGPETATNFEFGMKGVWAGGSLETNLALFKMDIEDLQVARALPGAGTAFEVKNAAEATSQGVELDGRWALTDNLTMNFNVAYLDASYDDFPGAATGCPVIGGTLDVASGLCNFAGIELIYAPEWKGGISFDYFADNSIGDWSLGARIGANYSGESYPEINYLESLKQDSYTTVDASLRLVSADESTTVSLIGRNLTEEYVNAWGLQAGFVEYKSPNAPREIAIQVSYDF